MNYENDLPTPGEWRRINIEFPAMDTSDPLIAAAAEEGAITGQRIIEFRPRDLFNYLHSLGKLDITWEDYVALVADNTRSDWMQRRELMRSINGAL